MPTSARQLPTQKRNFEMDEESSLFENKPVGSQASSSSLFEDGDGGFWADIENEPVDFDEDVYALAISDLAHDFERCGRGKACCQGVQVARFVADLLLLFGCVLIQVFLLREVKRYVTAKAVHDIRIAYGAYEMAMHGNDESHCEMTSNGFCRGIPGFFNASLFDTLDEDLQSAACRIPLSQPLFFGIILWIWTTTCLGQFMKLCRQFTSVILRTTTSTDNLLTYEQTDEELEAAEGTKIIYQLTLQVKAIVVTVVFLPRTLITGYLLWLGCRWLLATNNFGDLILNAVALEFILALGEVIYTAMAPMRNRHDLEKTKMLPLRRTTSVGYQQLGYILGFNAATCAWVYFYMVHFQMVLPDYRWDVSEVCKAWIAQRFAV